MDNLINVSKRILTINQTAAGVTEVDGGAIDMAGFDEVTFSAILQTVTGGASLNVKVQQSNDQGVNDAWADIAGAATGVHAPVSNSLESVSVWRPLKRYVRVVLLPTVQNVAFGGVIATLSQPRKDSVSSDTTEAQAVLVAPAS